MAYTTINKSSDYFNTKLYNGTTNTSDAITGIGFQPDLVWLKSRSNAGWHWWTDAARGVTKTIYSNESTAEQTNADGVTAFGADGFTIGNNTDINGSGKTFASWNWKANGAGSSNTDGSISSTVSANTTSGFSIVSYTGTGANATVGHGLGVAPKMIIIRRLNVLASWRIFHQAIGNTKNLRLNSTGGEQTSSTMWNNTSPTSTTFSLGSYDEVNGSSAPHIAYCFADVTGYSKFGSYAGNGNADGTFVYTGFTPAFIIYKHTTVGHSWIMEDVKRNISGNGYLNGSSSREFYPDANNAEATSGSRFDFLSNGFKIRDSSADINESGQTFIYMAFAAAPLVGSNNVPCTAR